jgi:predicted nuclease of restriction endonuclease-like (RecB) superfamily
MRLDSEKARNYYLTESKEQNWTVRVLERNIKSGYYERLLSTQKNVIAKTGKRETKNIDAFVKDPYINPESV